MMRSLHSEEMWLFDGVPHNIVMRARFLKIPFLWVGGVTFGRFIFLKKGLDDSNSRLIAHELVHSQQFDEFGIFGFLSRYIQNYLIQLKLTRNFKEAYLAIPFEVEARRRALEMFKEQK